MSDFTQHVEQLANRLQSHADGGDAPTSILNDMEQAAHLMTTMAKENLHLRNLVYLLRDAEDPQNVCVCPIELRQHDKHEPFCAVNTVARKIAESDAARKEARRELDDLIKKGTH